MTAADRGGSTITPRVVTDQRQRDLFTEDLRTPSYATYTTSRFPLILVRRSHLDLNLISPDSSSSRVEAARA